MTNERTKLTAYLQLARLSNLPTVFSNVLVGAALAAGGGALPWDDIGFILLAASLFYVGGMALNDLLDRNIDAEERAERPIPTGALTVREVTVFTVLSAGLGLVLVIARLPYATPFAFGLVAAIFCYDVLHKRWAGSVIFMGLCRAFVYAMAAGAVVRWPWPPAVATHTVVFGGLLALYIVLLTVVARKEAKGTLGFRRWLAWLIVVLPLMVLFTGLPVDGRWAVPAGALLAVWLVRSVRFLWQSPPQVKPAVLGWLAGISLIDGFFLTFTPHPHLAVAAWLCFAVTVWGHRRIAGT